jgi:ADP-heptose:LPS heptosyltransferase
VTGVEKILVVRVGRGGDLIMTTPALNHVLAAFPEAEVHLLTSREGPRVLRGFHPRIKRTWVYHRRFLQSWWLRRKLRRELTQERYTRVYVFETDPHYRGWLEGVAPALFGLDPGPSKTHYCERCMEIVERSVDSPPPRGWVTLPVTEKGLNKARALLSDHGVEPGTTLVGLHPTFSGSRLPAFLDAKGTRHRTWPRESFARLARLLDDRARSSGKPVTIVIDALPQERPLVETIVRQSGGAITLLRAPPDFERYKGLLQCLDVLVAPNTGPMHIAAAVGTPVVALFSGWSVEDCGPYVAEGRSVVLRAEDTDSPQRGLAAIEPERVVDAVFDLLDGVSS